MQKNYKLSYLATAVIVASMATNANANDDQAISNTGSAVPVVCLADNIEDVDLALYGGLLSWLPEAFQKDEAPPVGSGHFIPAGTGFVVGEDDKFSYVVTNWHVFSACNSGGRYGKDYLQVGILEATGNEIQAIAADPIFFKEEEKEGERVYRPAQIKTICKNEDIRCPQPLPKGVVNSPDDFSLLSEKQKDLIDIYAPDIAVLRLRRKVSLSPVTLDTKGAIKTKKSLEAFGFPVTTMVGDQRRDRNRNLIAQPTRATLFYSGESPITNEKFGMRAEDVVNVNMNRLSGSLYPGNSGSPIVLDNNLVVGMATLSYQGNDNAEATTSEDIVDMLEFLEIPHITNADSIAGADNPADADDEVGESKSETSTNPDMTENENIKANVSNDSPIDESGNKIFGLDSKILMIGVGILAALLATLMAFFVLAGKRKKDQDAANQALKEQELRRHRQELEDERQRNRQAIAQIQQNTVQQESPNLDKTVPLYSDATVSIQVTAGVNKGDYILPLPNGSRTLVVGRDPDVCQLVYPNHENGISKNHCVFRWDVEHKKLTVRDNSTHGVFVNEKRIEKNVEVALNHNDYVDLGAVRNNRMIVKKV